MEKHYFLAKRTTVSCIERVYKKYINITKEKSPDLFKKEKYSLHSMRHTSGQHIKAGIPLTVIKSFLGHESVQATQIDAENLRATVDKHIQE